MTSFDARTIFSVDEQDSIDLRTGNLTFIAPIGGPQQVRGPLSYELMAVFNSGVWARRSMGEIPDDGGGMLPGLPPGALTSASYPESGFNLGWGWGLHLGRLSAPERFEGGWPGCGPNDQNFEIRPFATPRYVYIDPTGTSHEFWTELHGDTGDHSDPVYEADQLLYTRDGSFLRMSKKSSVERWIEQPDGIVRVFRKRTAVEPTMPDDWLLERIFDPYGNEIHIEYGVFEVAGTNMNAWRIFDLQGSGATPSWRETRVGFEDWNGRRANEPMVVKKVELPGFGGSTRVWTFNYGEGAGQPVFPRFVDRPSTSSWHDALALECNAIGVAVDVRARKPRLASITQPDGSTYQFNYEGALPDDVRLASVALPTGGTISYGYSEVWDAPPNCGGPGPKLWRSPAVAERTVTDPDGQLARKRFLRQLRRTPDIPDDICRTHTSGPSSGAIPYAEQTVAVWQDVQADSAGPSSLSVHYFSVWPFTDKCLADMADPEQCVNANSGKGLPADWRLKTGRTHAERNANISRGNPDPLDESLFLSTRLYSCPWNLDANIAIGFDPLGGDFVGDDVDDLIDANIVSPQTTGPDCSLRQETYSKIEVSLAGRCATFSGHCNRDTRVKAQRTVYPLDGGRWVRVDSNDYDGLGHYRKTVTTSNFANGGAGVEVQRTFTHYNRGVGTLRLNPDHTVIGTGINVPPIWLTEKHEEFWTREGGVYSGGEACFHATRGHRTFDRKWIKTALTENVNQVAANRSTADLVVRHHVTGVGEMTYQRFLGAETYPAGQDMPTQDGWCSQLTKFKRAHQDYGIDYNYDFGYLKEKFVDGESTFEVRRDVDPSTGLSISENLDTGEVLDYRYDPMNRITWITSSGPAGPLSASRNFKYERGQGRWKLTANVYEKGIQAATASPENLIRTTITRYDGLGRVRSENLPKANGARVSRTVTYHPNGKVASASALDNANRSTRFDYDVEGRVVLQKLPNGDSISYLHAGIRKTRTRNCVKTAFPSGQPNGEGICPGTLERVESLEERDFRGRTIRVIAGQDIDGQIATPDNQIQTTFAYDPQDNMISARRSHPEGGTVVPQFRNFQYNGLGFMTREKIPERAATDLRDFNTRGLARETESSGRVTKHTFDDLGRLTELRIKLDAQGTSRVIKTFTYGDSGGENSRLIAALRNNWREAADSGINKSGRWAVLSTFGYNAAGQRDSRTTDIQWIPDVGDPNASGHTVFTQGWDYDELGNVTAIIYPNCTGNQIEPCVPRTVTQEYEQGFFLTKVRAHALGSATGNALGATLRYHASGLVSRVIHASGGGKDIYGVSGGMPRISSIDLANGTTERRNLGLVTYDGTGNVTGIGNDTFVYDRHSRLVSARVAGTSSSYAYDNFDNHRLGVGTVDLDTNHLTGNTTYDAWGNWTTGGPGAGYLAVYDEVDKLAALYQPDGDNKLSIYDHDDLRILSLLRPGFQLTWTLRDGPRVLREYEGIHPAISLRKEYVYAGSRRLASERHPGGTIRRYHEDQVGNARLITSPSLQAKRPDYKPFGLEIGADSGEPTVGFQGHEDDGDVTYMRGRTYFPFSARFLQVDPGRDGSAWSSYAFAANNPLSLVDPTGRAPEPKALVIDRIDVVAYSPEVQGSQRRMLAQARRDGVKLGTDFTSDTAQILQEAGASAPVMAVAEAAMLLTPLPGAMAVGVIGFGGGSAVIDLTATKMAEGAAGGAVIALADGELTASDAPGMVAATLAGGLTKKGASIVGGAAAAGTKQLIKNLTSDDSGSVSQEDLIELHQRLLELEGEVEGLKEQQVEDE